MANNRNIICSSGVRSCIDDVLQLLSQNGGGSCLPGANELAGGNLRGRDYRQGGYEHTLAEVSALALTYQRVIHKDGRVTTVT